MSVFSLPTKSQIHLCLGETEARALWDLIELHLLRELNDDPDAQRELTATLKFRLRTLEEIATAIGRETRAVGWPVS